MSDFHDIWYSFFINKELSTNWEFCKNWLTDSHMLLKSVTEFLPVLSNFLPDLSVNTSNLHTLLLSKCEFSEYCCSESYIYLRMHIKFCHIFHTSHHSAIKCSTRDAHQKASYYVYHERVYLEAKNSFANSVYYIMQCTIYNLDYSCFFFCHAFSNFQCQKMWYCVSHNCHFSYL